MDKNSKVALGVLGLGAVITAVVLATRKTSAAAPGTSSDGIGSGRLCPRNNSNCSLAFWHVRR